MDQHPNDFWQCPFPERDTRRASSPPQVSLPIPDSPTMNGRLSHRSSILEETKQSLLVHSHKGINDTGRNVADILCDRETLGSQALTSMYRYPRSKRIFDAQNHRIGEDFYQRGGDIGDRSPSTVFDSPPQQHLVNHQIGADSIGSLHGQNQMISIDDPASRDISNNAKPEQSPARRVIYPRTLSTELRTFGEYCTATKYHSAFLTHLGGDDVLDEEGNRPPSSRAVSTISIAFSPNGKTMASTHGDHTVKLSCCHTGKLLESLEGHPRTPWTVKYHPKDSRIVASGCLGHQVRVWNWETKSCLQMIRLEFAIISLSFHPSGKVLAIANGSRLHFWGMEAIAGSENSMTASASGAMQAPRSTRLTEMDQRHMLRCVHFPPGGDTLIIGGVNPIQEDPRRRRDGSGGNTGMSFYLRLWDFDLKKSLETFTDRDLGPTMGVSMARRAIYNPRTFVPRALLYNDGGFDVSPDGETLCACAEYWLPEGVDNAMDLMRQEEIAYEKEMRLKDPSSDSNGKDATELNAAETHCAASAALAGLKSLKETNLSSHGRSPSFREDMAQNPNQTISKQTNCSSPERHCAPPKNAHLSAPVKGFVPRTPPVSAEPRLRNLSPPPPPGSRFMRQSRGSVSTVGGQPLPSQTGARPSSEPIPSQNGDNGNGQVLSTPPPPPPPPPPQAPGGMHMRPPHPLSVISASSFPANGQSNEGFTARGRYVPHVVTVSLDTTPLPEGVIDFTLPRGKPPGAVAKGYKPRLGQLLEACPLDANKASAVTCVKYSPSTDFCLIGYGVREPVSDGRGNSHPVTAVFRVRGGMQHVSTMLSSDDDVNIARFHPESGHSFVYGTKQGRVRVLGPKPWNFYG